MGSAPLVTVVIPSYNAERWIHETVESALAQTYPCVEVVVVDDCSKDATRSILDSFKNRIQVIKNAQNGGVSASRNAAIQAAQGEYIAFLDHDDLWHPDKLTKQMALFEKNNALGLVYCDAFYQPTTQKRWQFLHLHAPFRGMLFEELLFQNFIPCLTAVIPRRVLDQVGTFREDFHSGEEYDLFLRIAERFPMDYVAEPLATYRIHDQNFSRNLDVRYGELLQILGQYAGKPGIPGLKAMVFIRWGMETLRADRRYAKSVTRILRGIMMAFKDLPGFYAALGESLRQRRMARGLRRA